MTRRGDLPVLVGGQLLHLHHRGELREFPVTVSDGAMTLQFLGKKNQNAVVSGLEIVGPLAQATRYGASADSSKRIPVPGCSVGRTAPSRTCWGSTR